MRLVLLILGLAALAVAQNVNCTVGSFSSYSRCTKECNSGIMFRTRSIRTPPQGNGAPCPILNQTTICNTQFCRDELNGRGFQAWGPWYGPAQIRYLISSSGSDIDILVFNENSYQYYVEDQNRPKPYNTGYTLVPGSVLETDNADQTINLMSGDRYYLVVDHTPVGSANGNNGEFNRISFSWFFSGISDEDKGYPVNTNPVSSGSLAAPSVLALAAALAAALLL